MEISIDTHFSEENDSINKAKINDQAPNANGDTVSDVASSRQFFAAPNGLEEEGYLRLVGYILAHGVSRPDRTGTGTWSVFGPQLRFSLRDGVLPLLTTKKVFTRGILEELLWFIRGSTDAKELAAKKVGIWDANGSRAFLDNLGFTDREEGDLGPVYGFQWRHSGAEYTTKDADYTNQGVDQLANVVKLIRERPWDRRILMVAWNPKDLAKMALPPCHCLVQFYVANDELSCMMYQRSADLGLGVPFNITSYALLTHMIAHVTGLKTGDFVLTMGDAHVYFNHKEALQEQITRKPKPFPKLEFTRQVTEIDDFKIDDFKVVGYECHSKLAMQMAV